MSAPRTVRFGPRALLVEVADASEALDLAAWARGRVEARDIVPAATTVLLDGVVDLDLAHSALEQWRPGARSGAGALVEVPTRYDGPDLRVVADVWGVGVEEVIERHAGAEHVVAFCGFAPGFPYMISTPPLPEVPRQASPRARVEPGSVALAGQWSGIYPTASPGGWQVIGRTSLTLFDSARDQPALLPPGTRVRFVAT